MINLIKEFLNINLDYKVMSDLEVVIETFYYKVLIKKCYNYIF